MPSIDDYEAKSIFDSIAHYIEEKYVCEALDLVPKDDHDDLKRELEEAQAEIASLTASLEGAREEIAQLEKEKE